MHRNPSAPRPSVGRLAPLSALLLLSTAALAGSETVYLVAGQHDVIGTVTVEDDGATLTVTYLVTDPDWSLGETHLYVGTTAPSRQSPGRFPYQHSDLGGATSDSYVIDLSDFGECPALWVAAHAATDHFVGYAPPDHAAFNASLPAGNVPLSVGYPGAGGAVSSYFDTSLWFDDATCAGPADGVFDGGCIDTDRTISPGACYSADLVSSIDPAFATTTYNGAPIFDHAAAYDNLDLVNWVLNQEWPGQTCTADGRAFTFGDVQRAIWTLVEDNVSSAGLGTWSQACADEILADAAANGEDFAPDCFDLVMVAAVPLNATGDISAQIVYGSFTLDCEALFEDETAWGLPDDGGIAFGQGWGEYFSYATCEDGGWEGEGIE